METTLMIGDFIYLTLIVIFFGGASGMVTNNIKSLGGKIENIEKKIDLLIGKQADEAIQEQA